MGCRTIAKTHKVIYLRTPEVSIVASKAELATLGTGTIFYIRYADFKFAIDHEAVFFYRNYKSVYGDEILANLLAAYYPERPAVVLRYLDAAKMRHVVDPLQRQQMGSQELLGRALMVYLDARGGH